jgi:putative DNA primase/helicase
VSAYNLRDMACRLGGEVSGRNQVICPGPGHTKQDRSLSVRFDSGAPEGFLVHSFAGDDPIRCRDYVREQLGRPAWQPGDERNRSSPSQRMEFDQAAMDREAEYRPRTEDDLFRIKRAAELWHSAKEPRRTAAEDYLRSRALKLDDDLVDTVLRFHPRCPWRNEDTGLTEIPALLAAFRSLDDDTITGVHRIRLDQPQYWPKAERRMLGIVRRAAVKFDAVGRDLIIGEGVETCMAARQLGHKPAWALGSVGAISFFPIIEGVKRLLILGETGNASEEAIRLCGRRWHRAGRRVQVMMPDIGSDINDELIAREM